MQKTLRVAESALAEFRGSGRGMAPRSLVRLVQESAILLGLEISSGMGGIELPSFCLWDFIFVELGVEEWGSHEI